MFAINHNLPLPLFSNLKVTIRFWCNGRIGKQSEWWFAEKVAFLPILSVFWNHQWSIPGKLSIICDHYFGTGVKLKGRWRWIWTNHILCSPILLPRSCWPTSDFWVLRGSQLSSDLFLLKNQFVIYSPNFKLLILVFLRCKNRRIVAGG